MPNSAAAAVSELHTIQAAQATAHQVDVEVCRSLASFKSGDARLLITLFTCVFVYLCETSRAVRKVAALSASKQMARNTTPLFNEVMVVDAFLEEEEKVGDGKITFYTRVA